jgi:tripartite-type tricarboxylate transporter receptor subunit TctC/plastocyanin
MTTCPNCGTSIDATDTFCRDCGQDLTQSGPENTSGQSGTSQPGGTGQQQNQQGGESQQPPGGGQPGPQGTAGDAGATRQGGATQNQPQRSGHQPQQSGRQGAAGAGQQPPQRGGGQGTQHGGQQPPQHGGQQPPQHGGQQPPQHGGQQPPQHGGQGPNSGQRRRTLLQAGGLLALLGGGGLVYALQDDGIDVPVLEGDSSSDSDSGGDSSSGGDSGGGEESNDGGENDGDPYDGWMSDVPNHEGTYDYRGQSHVVVDVQYETFEPPAILVDPGTTVVWQWRNDAGHSITAEDGSFESGIQSNDQAGSVAGAAPVPQVAGGFRYTFDEAGTTRYYCTPHEVIGQKGVVAVGSTDDQVLEPEESGGGTTEEFPAREITWLASARTPTVEALAGAASDQLGVQVDLEEAAPRESYDVLAQQARAAGADGYTVGTIASHIAAFDVGPGPFFDEVVPLLQYLSAPAALTVRPGYAESVEGFVERGQAEPPRIGVLDIDTPEAAQIGAAVLQNEFDFEARFEPAPPTPQLFEMLMTGELDATTAPLGLATADQLEELRSLAVFSQERLAWREEIPTFEELGHSVPPVAYCEGIGVPSGVASDRLDLLRTEFAEAYEHPDVRRAMVESRQNPQYRPGDEFASFIEFQADLAGEFL